MSQTASFPLDALSARLESVPARHASFVEDKYLHALRKPLHSRGELFYRRPDDLAKITLDPSLERMVVDDAKLSVTEGSGEPRVIALDSRPEIRAFIDTIRGALSGNINLLQHYYKIEGEGSLAGWSLALTPLDATVGRILQKVRIDGAGGDVTFIQIVQANGDDDRMTITPLP
jgi:hypothetical protein